MSNTCGKPVESYGTMVGYPCELVVGHEGPHASAEIPASVTRRQEHLKSAEGSGSENAEPMDALGDAWDEVVKNPAAMPGAEEESSDLNVPEEAPLLPRPPLPSVQEGIDHAVVDGLRTVRGMLASAESILGSLEALVGRGQREGS